MERFVCVRIVQAWGLDLSLFQFDWRQTWMVFLMNSDRALYGRYDARQADGRKNVRVGTGATRMNGVEEPIYYWVPSIAPSGMMFYTGDLFPAWKGNLFVGAMSAAHGHQLVRLVLNGDRVAAEERLLAERKARIRQVRQAPDGSIYVIAGSEIWRLTPKK